MHPLQLIEQAEVLHTAEAVQAAIHRLGHEITLSLKDTCPVVICVMSGAVVFSGQLLTQLHFPLELDYVHASRYGNDTTGKTLSWKSLPKLDLTGRTVLILDDILDEGITLKAVIEKCIELGASRVLSAVLIEKMLDYAKPATAEFVGLHVPNRYVFGCGLDIYGWWRNLPAIYALT